MEITFAGFGGQGVLTSGLITAYIALKNDYEVLWTPAYGGQMRGGKAYSTVIFDKDPITEPLMTDIDVLVAMNIPSLDFISNLKSDGLLIVNSDNIDETIEIKTTAKIVRVPCNTLAAKVSSTKTANIVAIGALIYELGLMDQNSAKETMCEFFANKGKDKFNDTNRKAFDEGYNYLHTSQEEIK